MRLSILPAILLLLPLQIFAGGNSKLNTNIDILRYRFNLTLSDDYDTIRGSAVIDLRFLKAADSVRLDLESVRPDGKGMKVISVELNSASAGWKHNASKLAIAAGNSGKEGSNAVLTITYSGIPSNGLVISQTKFGQRSFFADHWPDRAGYYLPCIDHVSDKAAVEFIITAPEHYTVVSNGSLLEEKELPAGMKTTHWREDVPIPVKVMTFGAADFAFEQSGTAAGIPVWSYVYPENREEGFSDYALALKAVEFYSTLIGPYPFPKLANVQSKTMFGGLENAGCVFYSENSVTGTGRSEGLLAHEIAHQWFGNSVTEADWHHIWLSEGFATYLTSMYWEKEQGDERLKADMKSARDRVLRTSGTAPKPVIDTTITDLMRLLSANSYQKGAWVLHMLRHQTGDKEFRDGLRLYYSRYRDANALTEDFMTVMEEVSGQNLDWFFHQWLHVGGQPELRTEWTYDSVIGETEIVITQIQDYLFRFPLDLKIVTGNGEKIVRTECTEKITRLKINSGGKPVEVIPDPDVVLLFRPAL